MSKHESNLLIYTYADKEYSIFAVPYAYFALLHNPTAKVEIVLSDYSSFINENNKSILTLEKIFPNKCTFRQSNFTHEDPDIWPNAVRFLEMPHNQAEYLYIGDIDLLIMEDLLSVHIGLINQYNLKFSNIIRENTLEFPFPSLSGLHFCRFDQMYPLPDLSEVNLSAINDEQILHLIMDRKGHNQDPSFRVRPECGIHMSLSRSPTGKTTGPKNKNYKSSEKYHNWTGHQYFKDVLRVMEADSFRDIYMEFTPDFRCMFTILESLIYQKNRMLHRSAVSYMVDKSLVFHECEISQISLSKEADLAIKNHDLVEAENILSKINFLWPMEKTLWVKRAVVSFERGKSQVAVQSLLHVSDLEGGLEYLAGQDIINTYRQEITDNNLGQELFMKIETLKGAATVFDNIFKSNLWKSESRSGPGSSLNATQVIRSNLLRLFKDLNIRTVVDAPCGDAKWMAEVNSSLDKYIGLDIVPELIKENRRTFASKNMEFHVADIVSSNLPQCDLLLCRDCLVHLPLEMGLLALDNFCKSDIQYVAITTFPDWNVNKQIDIGAWRPLNLQLEPFKLPEPFDVLVDTVPSNDNPYSSKSVGVWKTDELRKHLSM